MEARKAGDLGQSAVGAREIRRIDDESVSERHEVVEMPRVAWWRPGPPQEYRQVRNEKRNDDAGDALVEVTVDAREDLLVQHRLPAI